MSNCADLPEPFAALDASIGVEAKPENVAIFYQDLSGKTKCLEVGSEVSLTALTELIAEGEGVPAADLHLFHEGSVDNSTVLPLFSSLTMSLRVGGGMFKMFRSKKPADGKNTSTPAAIAAAPTVAEPGADDLDELEALSRLIMKADLEKRSLTDRYGMDVAAKDPSQAIAEITQKIADPKIDKQTKLAQLEQLDGVKRMQELVELMASLALKRDQVVRRRRQEEEIRNLADELTKVPAGTPRHLILRCIISLELQSTTLPELPSNPLFCDVDIHDAVTVQIPMLLDKFKLSSGFVWSKLLAIDTAATSTEKLSMLHELLREIYPLNVHKLVRLLDKSKMAANCMEGKNVILFAGTTGAGVSTTIQFLTGSRMVKTEVPVGFDDYARVSHISSAADGGPETASVISSPFCESQTDCINPVSFPVCRVWKDCEPGLIVTLCDTPAWKSTFGPEADIVRGLGLIAAAKECADVKLVFVLSYRSFGSYSTGLEDFIEMVLGMVDGISQQDKSRLEGVHYLYTKFPDAQEVFSVLSNFRTALIRRVGPSVAPTVPTVWILDDMIEKATRRISVVNPLSDNPGKLLQELLVNGEGMDGSALLFWMALECKTAVTKEVTTELEILKTAMELKEFDVVLHHLENLRLLSELINLECARASYQSAVTIVAKHIADFCKITATDFVELMRSNDGISQEDFAACKHAMQVLKDAQVFRPYVQDSLVYPSALSAEVNVALKELRAHTLNALPADDCTIKTYLDNLKLIKEEFAEFSVQYDDDVEFIKTKLTTSEAELQANLAAAMSELVKENEREQQLANIAGNCQAVLRAISNLTLHVDVEAGKVNKILETVKRHSANASALSDGSIRLRLESREMSELATALHSWEIAILSNWDSNETDAVVANLRNIAVTVPTMSTLTAHVQMLVAAATKHLTGVDFVRQDIAHSDRALKEHFVKIVDSLQRLRSLRRDLTSLHVSGLDLEQTRSDWEGIIAAKLHALGNAMVALASKIVVTNIRAGKDCKDLLGLHLHLKAFAEVNKESIGGRPIVPHCDTSTYIAETERFILAKVHAHAAEVCTLLCTFLDDNRALQRIAECLLDLKFMATELFMYTAVIDQEIDALLLKFKAERRMMGLTALCNLLSEHDLGVRLIAEHNVLGGERIRWINEQMREQDSLEYVKNALRGDHIDWPILEAKYKRFENIYQLVLSQCIERSAGNIRNIPMHDIVVRIKELLKAMKLEVLQTNVAVLQWINRIKDYLPELIALISVLWTLMNADNFYEFRGMVGCEMYLIKPQTAQVMAMFRMLGIGYAREGRVGIPNHIHIENNLTQIGAGEGKGMVLAVCASVFALMGMEVNVSCCSEYLADCGRQQFAELFMLLGVDKLIQYGTIDRLCENLFNSQVSVSDAVQDLLLNNRAELTASNGARREMPKVLLIDEVDALFSDKFFGQEYLPSVIINDDTVQVFLDALWDLNKQQKVDNMSIIKNCLRGPYEALMARFSNYTKLIEGAIKDMVSALSGFRSATWYVQNDKICYEYGEPIVHLGPDTVWAYYEEHDKKAISDESLRANVGISVKCGQFSCTEVPKEFAFIAGVSCRLDTLSAFEMSFLRSVHNFTKNTFMAPLFRVDLRVFNPREDVHILNSAHFFQKIREEIDMMRIAGRPVLIVFPTMEALYNFHISAPMADIQHQVILLTDETPVWLRQSLINKSTAGANVTLLTRSFDRGTDFICKNPQVRGSGGIHVIQAFFSPELSEEMQMMNCCARQGEPGSFRIMMLDSDLKCLLGSQWRTEIATIDISNCYDALSERRNKLHLANYNGNMARIDELNSQHAFSKEFVQSIVACDIAKCKEFLEVHNKGASLGIGFSRTLLLLNATGSMGGMISVAKNCIGTVFQRASDVLQTCGLPADCFQVQFAVYRDYDCGVNEILRTSAWHTDPTNLRVFMEGIRATGGANGDEAIEIGLWHANQEASSENGLSQIILIGDAPANQAAVVAQHRRDYGGEGLWAGSRFGPATDVTAEVATLRRRHVPIHTLFLARGAVEANLKTIAGVDEAIPDALKGRCEYLDIMDPQSTAQFIDFVTQEVLRSCAGAMGMGNEVVERYQGFHGTLRHTD